MSRPCPLRRTRLMLAIGVALPALAVQAQQATTDAAAAPQPGKLETVTVTAERRSESIKDVPSSISTLRGEKLDVINSGGQDVRALSGRVPSLNIESSFGRAFPRFYIRGYGNTDFRLNASQPVSLIYDDVVQENPILKGFPVFDLDQIEVLRGPQGTLFGRNTPAGVVKFDSAKPTKKLEGYASLSYGSYGTANLEGAINVPLGEDWAARVSLLHQRRSDWVENTYDAGPTQDLEGYRDSAVRAQLLYAPHQDFSALFNVHGRDLDGSARLFRANIIEPGTNNLVAGFDEKKISIDGKNESKLKTKGGSARLRWGLGELALYSITGYETLDTYNRGDIDGGFGAVFAPPSGPGLIPFSSETADGIPDHKQFTQELRVESNYAGPLNWQAGLFYFHEDYRIESFSYDSLFTAGAQNGYERVRQKNDAYAVFGALSYAVSPQLKLRGGLRYTHDKKEFNVEDYNSAVFGTLPTLAALAAAGPLSANPSNNKFSWDLSGTYALDPDTNLYARVANGFRAASIQGAGAFNNQSIAQPETNTSIEAGIKADLFERRARLSFGVFYYTVKDQQLTAVGGAANSNILLNAEKTVGKGFELDLQGYLGDNLLGSIGVGYNHTRIKDPGLVVSACGNGQSGATPPTPNCTITDPNFYDAASNSQKANIDGNPLPQAPKVTANVTLRYAIPTETGEWYVFTDWAYRSKINFFLYESVEFTGKPLTEGGLRVGYIWGNGKYEAALFGRNITNQIRVTGGIDFNNLTGFINEPRMWGAQLRTAF
jgi:iron complex outermembrane receptor protein